jgi:predicted MPP superfamily phosphohydrolase
LGAGLAAGALAFGVDSVILEPNHPHLVRQEFWLSRLPAVLDGFTIVHLSDFHYDEHIGVIPIRKAVAIANSLRADLVVLTGDFVTLSFFADIIHDQEKSARTAEPCAQLLKGLQSRHGLVAVLGNHDVAADAVVVSEALTSTGITVLRNSSQAIERDGARLWLCGLDSWEGKPKMDVAMRGIPGGEAVIVLMHEPDYAEKVSRYPVDLQLSGHSHGGQIWLPGIGAPWLPFGAHKYPRGRYQVGSLQLYTNIGLGTIRLPMRVNCPPEVTLVTLRAGKAT